MSGKGRRGESGERVPSSGGMAVLQQTAAEVLNRCFYLCSNEKTVKILEAELCGSEAEVWISVKTRGMYSYVFNEFLKGQFKLGM